MTRALNTTRSPLPQILFTAAVILAALMVRYAVVEPEAMGHLCSSGRGPWWCTGRDLVVWGFYFGIYGWGGVVAMAGSLLASGRSAQVLLHLGLAFGALALVFYWPGFGALVLVTGLLRTLALESRATPAT